MRGLFKVVETMLVAIARNEMFDFVWTDQYSSRQGVLRAPGFSCALLGTPNFAFPWRF